MTTIRNTSKYGWKRDLPDKRDLKFKTIMPVKKLPEKVDLRPFCPKKVYDQKNIGACTACAVAAAIEFDRIKQKLNPIFTPSRLFIYYNTRILEGTVQEDAGASLRDTMKSVSSYGAPSEILWPYIESKFMQKPSSQAYKDGLRHKILKYMSVEQTLAHIKGCLVEGYPIVLGISIYESFETPEITKSGIIPMPKADETLLGGHAIFLCGFNDKTKTYLGRNSWGQKWGQAGHFEIPYDYILDPDLASDFWTVRLVI